MKIKLQKIEARKVLQILAKEKKQLKNNLKVTKESSFLSEEQLVQSFSDRTDGYYTL